MTHKLTKTEKYLLVVDDSIQQIKKGEYFLLGGKHVNMWGGLGSKSLATISHKIIAHLPLNGSPILEGVNLLPPTEDDVEKLAFRPAIEYKTKYEDSNTYDFRKGYKAGYNKARDKYKYTEEDVIHLLHRTARQYFQEGREYKGNMAIAGDPLHGVRRELINMVQSLHQYPTEFECEMEDYCGSPLTTERCPKCIDICDRAYQRPKTITTAQGIQWVGKYK